MAVADPDLTSAPLVAEPDWNWRQGAKLAELPHVHIYTWRAQMLARYKADAQLLAAAHAYYREHPTQWICHWVTTFDPRLAIHGTPFMPFILFDKQRQFVEFVYACLKAQANGLAEKARDMGLTWLCGAIAIHLWRYYKGADIGFGSRKQELVDVLGDASSIFEKLRILLRNLPRCMRPEGFDLKRHMMHMRISNPENGNVITGELGDNIGRGGRKLAYFKDESAHYEHAELIEASLLSNTNCQIDVSSVKGLGTVFHRKRTSGQDWQPGVEITRERTNVFVMDYSDHPEKDREWFRRSRDDYAMRGLLHLFAQEVERNYAASVEGIVIQPDWVDAAIDAHVRLGFTDEGGWIAGLDVADMGGDTNALAIRKGVILQDLREWHERDVGVTTRNAIAACATLPVPGEQHLFLNYDAVSLGAAVKAEYNRLVEEEQMPPHIRLVAWNGGGAVLDPEHRIIEDESKLRQDRNSVLNKDFYGNLKAQGWWQLGRRFERTFRAVNGARARAEGHTAHPDHDYAPKPGELISLPSGLPLLMKLKGELSQAAIKYNAALKILIDKQPEGTKSPNLADSLVMCCWPQRFAGPIQVGERVMQLVKAKQRFPGFTRGIRQRAPWGPQRIKPTAPPMMRRGW